MATALGPTEPSAAHVVGANAASVVVSLGRTSLIPPRTPAYVVTGPLEMGSRRIPDIPEGTRAVICNEEEAGILTGREDPAAAARALGELAETAVVTRGPAGALGVERGRLADAAAPAVTVVDATGAGDLFVVAYLWADRRGMPLEPRLAWACLYAGLSVRAPTAFAGAVGLEELLAEGKRRGLSLP
jgi:sugar/nucleoside kinase (ribokinase family)